MRIIAGTWRGRRLASVGKGDLAARLRPTPDRVRESLFSVLEARLNLSGMHVLDLFAGTGALTFEALSRGAAHGTLVDNGRAASRLIMANIDALDARAVLLRADAARLPPNAGPPADLVFADPPYGRDLAAAALSRAVSGGWIAPGTWISIEDSRPHEAIPGAVGEFQKRYGDTWITLMRRSAT